MDDYKENLIEMVRVRPLLWDPRVPDYKNKDQRTRVWDELKDLLTAPKGTTWTCTPKDVWESLVRCNNNALLRVKANKKSGSGADNSKPWKFLKQMEFLNPIKIIRNSKGNLSQERDEDDILQTAMIEADVWSEGEEVDVPEQFVAVVEKRAGSEQGGKKHKKKKVDDNDDDNYYLFIEKKN
ncbi:transcription factor Adf-1 [Elysia marginata]|uniref:Transcription factor Adf-1 n=1 Tax=Elysia marginata TaxID=1093978 RepID=A0AAV4GZL6_9GAST|nr:transcription factor Adf-1 [Elysia marginata]